MFSPSHCYYSYPEPTPSTVTLSPLLLPSTSPFSSLTPSTLTPHTPLSPLLLLLPPSHRRALDLIFVLVDESNSEEVVGELVLSLSSAQSALKEDMVVKIAILAEKYSPGLFTDVLICFVLCYICTLTVLSSQVVVFSPLLPSLSTIPFSLPSPLLPPCPLISPLTSLPHSFLLPSPPPTPRQ